MIRALRNLSRLLEIARILGRHNALFPAELRLYAPGLALVARLLSRAKVPGRPGERLAAALKEMGPSFIKLGQMLSTRPDLVGQSIAEDLAELQDKLPPFPAAQARATIEQELEQPLESIFLSFDDQPVAAASIAQVHFATVTNRDGSVREVAVKVLRPGIELAFRRDLDLFYWLAHLAEKFRPSLKRLRFVEVVDILAETVHLEMDLRMEAAAASELAENFTGDDTFNVPRVDWDRTSRRVMTLERIHGIPVDEVERMRQSGINPDDILRQAADAFFNQVFRDGFFHADLHPGNLFVNTHGTLTVVDFGIMGRLDKATRYFLADMLIGFLSGDYRRVAEVHFRAGYIPANQKIDTFTQALRAIGEPLLNKPLHEISIARLLSQLFATTERFQMETQPQLLLLQKSMLTAEGVGRTLNPTINMWELARPLIEDWMRENRGPEARAADYLGQMADVLYRLPGVLREAENTIVTLSQQGLKLHPETVRHLANSRDDMRPQLAGLWIGLIAVGTVALLSYAM